MSSTSTFTTSCYVVLLGRRIPLEEIDLGIAVGVGGRAERPRVGEGRQHDLAERVPGGGEGAVVEGRPGLLQDGFEQVHLLAGQGRRHELVGLALRHRRRWLDHEPRLALDVHARLGGATEGEASIRRPERSAGDRILQHREVAALVERVRGEAVQVGEDQLRSVGRPGQSRQEGARSGLAHHQQLVDAFGLQSLRDGGRFGVVGRGVGGRRVHDDLLDWLDAGRGQDRNDPLLEQLLISGVGQHRQLAVQLARLGHGVHHVDLEVLAGIGAEPGRLRLGQPRPAS